MRILVLGGTGFIGTPLVQQLARGPHDVAVFHRGETMPDLPGSVHVFQGDRSDLHAAWSDFTGFAPHVVIDMIAYTEDEAKLAVEVFSGLVSRAVVIGSGDVYRNYEGLRGTGAQPPDPVPLAEDAPLRESRYPYREFADRAEEHLYNYDKILVEEAYRASDALTCTVLRLPMVYGPDDPQRRIFSYLKRMDDGRPAILLGAEQADWQWTRGYVENVAAAIALAATEEDAAGRTYNVGEADTATEAAWVRRIAAAANWRGEIVTVPSDALPEHLRPELDLHYDLALDTSRIRRELGYNEPVPPEEAMAQTVTWTRAHPPASIDEQAFDYEAEDAVLQRHTELR